MPSYKSNRKHPFALFCVIFFIAAVLLVISIFVSFSAAETVQNKEEEKQPVAETVQNKEEEKQPIVVNGNTVEYSTENRQVTAQGNVSVDYKEVKLTCDKLTVNTLTKDGEAVGDVRLEDKQGVIEGQGMNYNFQSKAGVIMEARFRSNPYFARAEKAVKVSENEILLKRSQMTTCSYDNPHYRIKSKKVNFFPGDKIQMQDNTFYAGGFPLFYIPRYNHSLKEPLAHVQLMPGKSKEWGAYLLTAWRYNLTEDVTGRIYFDERQKIGNAQGFGVNYKTFKFGKGDFKYYYTQERDRHFNEGVPAKFQRYLIRARHKWDIDNQTNVTAQYYKIVDSKRSTKGVAGVSSNEAYDFSNSDFLKDYFYREYEKDSFPNSYVSIHHGFNRSSMDLVVDKRVNRWYPQMIEKLPEVKYSFPTSQILESPFNFENNTAAANLNRKDPVPSSSVNDLSTQRFDMFNKISVPVKVAFVRFSPFVQNRETLYDTDIYGSSIPPRTIFYAGTDASTKFFRLFDTKPHFLGMDINDIRHIITPTIAYTFNHEPTIPSSKLKQIDGVDSVNRNNSASLELSNKLQTKRNGKSVDFVDFRVNSTYTFKPKDATSSEGSSLSDILFDLRFLPYTWLSLDADATYKHSGARDVENYNSFSNVNYDVGFNLGEERSFGWGQRYTMSNTSSDNNEIIFNVKWRFNPKWKFAWYQRYQRGHDPVFKRGLREQEYTLSRDLHCWTWDITYNVKRGEGESIFFIFRLKAFPELEFNFGQDYHQPKPGSQSNP